MQVRMQAWMERAAACKCGVLAEWNRTVLQPATSTCFCSTCVGEELGGLQDFLGVDSGFIIIHFRGDHVDNSGSTASNSPSGAIQAINIFLLQSNDTLIHILQDVVLWRRTKEMQLVVYTLYN